MPLTKFNAASLGTRYIFSSENFGQSMSLASFGNNPDVQGPGISFGHGELRWEWL